MLRPNTLKWKIILFSVSIVAVIGGTGFYLYYSESVFLNNYNLLIENILSTQQLDSIVSYNSDILQKYKATESRNYIAQLNSNKEMMDIIISELNDQISNTKVQTQLKQLKNSTDRYSQVINSIIFSDTGDRGGHISEAEELLNQISMGVKTVYDFQTDEIRNNYRVFNDNKKNAEIMTLVAFLIILLFSLVSIFLFINRLLKPVRELTSAARVISRGDFGIPELNVNTPTEEMNILTSAFRQMVESIRKYVEELNAKVDVEKKLKEEEVKNERNQLLLKEAELMALQSQVNPHFIFNTLNIIAKIAYMEDAERTANIIGSMSKMLRYSLGRLDKVVSLEQEIQNLDEYMFIQKTRFGDRLAYIKNIACDISDIFVPSLTLQPIVENAIMHGIENKEEGGYVSIHCRDDAGQVVIEIKDNGVGISQALLEKILSKTEQIPHKGHTTGLGINNVKERLELFSGQKNVFEIHSAENKGTEVVIRVPRRTDNGGGNLHV